MKTRDTLESVAGQVQHAKGCGGGFITSEVAAEGGGGEGCLGRNTGVYGGNLIWLARTDAPGVTAAPAALRLNSCVSGPEHPRPAARKGGSTGLLIAKCQLAQPAPAEPSTCQGPPIPRWRSCFRPRTGWAVRAAREDVRCDVRARRPPLARPGQATRFAVVRLSSSGGPPVRILLPADEVIARAAAISGGRVGAPPPPRELRVSSSIWRASCIPGKRPGCRLCRTRPELTLAPCPPCP